MDKLILYFKLTILVLIPLLAMVSCGVAVGISYTGGYYGLS
jgi:uncharacterized membrane protein